MARSSTYYKKRPLKDEPATERAIEQLYEEDAIEMTAEWMEYYNRERPHSALKNSSPLMYRENSATPLPANFWRDFSAPARLAALRAAPSLRSGRNAYATKSRQKWIDIRGYRAITHTHTPDEHEQKGLKLAS